MSTHPEEHEVWLGEALAGETPERELALRLAQCQTCRARWERLRGVSARLEAAGRAQRTDVAALSEPAPAPQKERVLAVLERLAPLSPPPRRAWRGWLVALAALLLGLFLGAHWWQGRVPEPEPITLGAEPFDLVAPVGSTPSFERFVWTYDGEAASFELRVYADDEGRPELQRETGLTTTPWIPAPELWRSWPARIVWQVVALDDFGRPLHSSAQQPASLSSR